MSAHVRLAELTELSLTRALTPGETDELFRAHSIEDLRQRRLPARIMKLREELHALEADLWPCYLDRLKLLQAQADAARIARLESELGLAQAVAA
jgi:hypothetical protein